MQEIRVAAFLAARSIARAQKSSTILLISILLLSYLNLMFISGILSGLSAATIQQSINTQTSYIDIDPEQTPVQKTFIPDWADFRASLDRIPGVIASARHYNLGGTILYDRDKNGRPITLAVPVTGIDPSEEQQVTTIAENMIAGQYLDITKHDEIVLGSDITGGYGSATLDTLGGAQVGDKIVIRYQNGVERTYKIRGIYKVGFFSDTAFITYKEAQAVLGISNYASRVLVNVDPNYQPLSQYVSEIQALNPRNRVSTYDQLLGQTLQITLAFNAISLIVSAVSVLVAAITIFVLIYINAVNRRRQIGILKAIGIRQGVIILSYTFQSVFLTGISVALGSAIIFLGLGPYLQSHPINLPLGAVVLTFTPTGIALSIGSLLLAGVIAGVIPSWRVARQNILAAIWGA